jgi:hypothetical protein
VASRTGTAAPYTPVVAVLVVESKVWHRPGPSWSYGTVLAGLSTLPAVTVVWALSFPGFPTAAVWLLLLEVAVLTLLWVRRGKPLSQPQAARPISWMLPVAATILIGGLAMATTSGDAALHARWASSSAAFDAEVAALGTPRQLDAAYEVGQFVDLPGSCPTQIGRFAVGDCLAVHEGYLFLQAQNAVTDSSGIAYLPSGNRPALTGLNPADLTALGGPWWAWTCHC